ncbi:MAG: hypothetical protein V1862_02585 [Methanobacteriota archaeon]
MNYSIRLGFIVSFLLIFLVGTCIAVESPSYIANIQGGESVITSGTDGMSVVTVKDVVPNISVTNGNTSSLITVEELVNITHPLNAAFVISGADNKSVSLVEISNLSLSDDDTLLTLQVKPLTFYDGEGLKSYVDKQTELPSGNDREMNRTQFFIEFSVAIAENGSQTCYGCSYYYAPLNTCVNYIC